MLNLRNAVRNLPLLQKSLENTKSQLLRIIRDVFVLSLIFMPIQTRFSDVVGRTT